jgi:SH3-like domain-containing protein
MAADAVGRDTQLPLPRFVSIGKSEAYLRTGPGKQYPILVVLQRRGIPVKIIDEYQRWRKVELHDGVTGWLHKVLLTSRRTFLITAQSAPLHAEPSDTGPIIATAEKNVIADLEECTPLWCRVNVEGYDGWVLRTVGWGELSEPQPR